MSQAVAEPPKAGTTTTEPPPPKDTRTKEEIEAAAKEFKESWFSNEKPKKKEEPAVTTPAAAPETKPAATETAAAEGATELEKLATDAPEGGTTAATPAAAPVTAPVLDPEEITNRVVEGVTGALKGTQATPAVAPPVDPNANLSPADRRKIEALEYLEKHNPAYKGMPDRTREFFTREAAYKVKWLQENPGEQWNADDEQHNEFYQRFEPDINQDDLDDALVQVQVAKELPAQVDKVVSERMAPLQEQITQAQRIALETQIAPEVQKAASDAALSLITQAVPEFKDDLKKGLTPKAIEKIKTTDPEAFELIDREMGAIRGPVQELERMALMDTLYQPVSHNDRQKIDQVHYEMEMAEAGKAPDKRLTRDKKVWIPQGLLEKKIAAAKGNSKVIAEIESKFFCFSVDDIRNEFVRRAAGNVSSVLDIAKKRAERTSKKVEQNSTTQPAPEAVNGHVKPAPAVAPSIASVSDNVDGNIPRTADNRTEAEKFRESHFR